MAYQDITFEISKPCNIDIGDGQLTLYPAGVHTVTPKGYVIIENDSESDPLDNVKFLSNTIREINIQKGEELTSAEDMCKNLTNLTKFRFKGQNKITTFKSAFEKTSVKHFEKIYTSMGTVFDYMFKDNQDVLCLTDIDTTNQTSTTGMFSGTTSLINPTLAERFAIEAGTHYMNPGTCNDYSGPSVTPTPVLVGTSSSYDDTTIIFRITNWNPNYEYTANVSVGSVYVQDNYVYWVVPTTTTSVYSLSIYASNDGNVSSSNTYNVNIQTRTYTLDTLEINKQTGVGTGFNVNSYNDGWINLN